MVISNLKNRKRKGLRAAAGILAAILTVSVPFSGGAAVVFGAQTGQERNDLTGGMIDFVSEPIVSVIPEGTCGNSLQSIRPELRQYDWDCYSNDYYFSKLSTKEQQLYERLDAVCGKLLTSETLSATAYEVGSGKTTVERWGTETVSCLGLTAEQVKKVQAIFIYANPQYYFLNTILLTTNTNECAVGVYDAFAKGSSRAKQTKLVLERMEELQAQVSAGGTVYETEAQIHELICDELVYMEGDVMSDLTDPFYTQTVYGALINGETVCAGYTKLYAMLCNYFGIDCIAVTSSDHAWNEVRYGDHWYIVDVTWNDTRDRARYFHISDQRMRATDQNNSHVPYSFYDGIRPVADTTFSGSLMLLQGLSQPQVEVTDTASGVTITMSAEAGDIYYTLDGSTPGNDDRYTGPIELTTGGTYIVTAVTAGDGYISSAYEIFPVRIAGGSASISSASNVSGKKIKVKIKASKSYTGYEISYASKKDFSNQKTRKLSCQDLSGKSVVLTNLKKGTTYYIRVRGYKLDAYGNYYYTPYSKIKKVTAKK